MTDCPFPPGSRIFAYLRDSGHERQELSIAQQENQIRQFAIDNNLVLTTIYKDEAKRGGGAYIEGRAELQKMMHQLRRGCPEVGVVVWKANRLGRSQDHSALYRAEIRTLGKIFHALRDNVPDGPLGRLFEAFVDYTDEQHIRDMSIDVKRALADLVQIYGCVPGRPPVGFMRQPVTISYHRDGTPRHAARWVPDPEKLPTLRLAFAMRAAGQSINAIIDATSGALSASKNSYRGIFANKLYIGILEYGDLVIENYCEPVIDRVTWDEVQKKQRRYTKRSHTQASQPDQPRRANSRYLLSGLMTCARCGSPMSGHTSIQRNQSRTDSYICSRSVRNPGQCQRSRIPRQAIEEHITRLLLEHILETDLITAAQALGRSGEDSRLAELNNRRAEILQRLGNTRRQLGNVSKAIADHGHSKTLLQSLDYHERRETEQLNQLAEIEEQISSAVNALTPEQIETRLQRLKTVLANVTTDHQRRAIYRGLIHKITIQRENTRVFGEIYFYAPPPDIDSIPPTDSPSTAPPNDSTPQTPTVPTIPDPPGAPRYIHSLGFYFAVQKPWNWYKNKKPPS